MLQVLPRGMSFSIAAATSIDLFVSEVAAKSRFRIEVVAEVNGPALPAAKVHPLPPFAIAERLRRARCVARIACATNAQLLIVQQHLPSAAAIQARVRAPVLLQRHNFMRPPDRGSLGRLWRVRHVRQLNSLAGLTFVSQATLSEFERDWPEVETPRWVIPNGVDYSLWEPRTERERSVLVVGRATPEKGLLEAAVAISAALAPDWSATFVVSGTLRGASYLRDVRAALAPLGDRARVLTEAPFAMVKALNETAAVAMTPSKWREPFGRTALEAHAGGAALISSGNGGLREISGEAAIYVPDANVSALAEALSVLIANDELRRRFALAGGRRARELFDLNKVAAKLDDACESVIARRAGLAAVDRAGR